MNENEKSIIEKEIELLKKEVELLTKENKLITTEIENLKEENNKIRDEIKKLVKTKVLTVVMDESMKRRIGARNNPIDPKDPNSGVKIPNTRKNIKTSPVRSSKNRKGFEQTFTTCLKTNEKLIEIKPIKQKIK